DPREVRPALGTEAPEGVGDLAPRVGFAVVIEEARAVQREERERVRVAQEEALAVDAGPLVSLDEGAGSRDHRGIDAQAGEHFAGNRGAAARVGVLEILVARRPVL